MKTEFEKMRAGELYDYSAPDTDGSNRHARSLCAKLQGMTSNDQKYREIMEELIPDFPESSEICPPFYCDHGTGIHIGEHVYINMNCTMLDGGFITIGKHTLIGPNCSIYTPQHPLDYMERRKPQETCLPVSIGEDTWLGGNVTVCPGVKIGDRCIIAAGSVVTHDIPDDSLAAGVPAEVKRKL